MIGLFEILLICVIIFLLIIIYSNRNKKNTDDKIIISKYEKDDSKTFIIDELGNIYEPPETSSGVLDIEDLKHIGRKMSDGEYMWF